MAFALDLKIKESPKIATICLSSDDDKKNDYHNYYLTMLLFCENLKKAYELRDYDFIMKTLDKSLYIEIPEFILRDGMSSGRHSNHTLKKYRKSLDMIFVKNQKIEYHINNIEIVSHPTTEGVFGLSFEQNYTCGEYQNDNYYFSLWDFRKKDAPPVFCFGIQPVKTPEDAKIGVGDYDGLEKLDE